jgi:hypothetical protein
MGGEVNWTLTTSDTGLPQMRAGRVKLFAEALAALQKTEIVMVADHQGGPS